MSIIAERKELVNKYYTPARIEFLPGDKDFNKRLIIEIIGEPVSDGRPRENKEMQKFYNEKKEFLKQIFRVIYRKDTLLQKLCIITPHRINIVTYSYPTKKDLQFLSNEDLEKECVRSIGNKDNDNVEKVHWDVLQDTEFMIILNDSSTTENYTRKYYSFKPRTLIIIDFADDFTSDLYRFKITTSVEYRFYLSSKKYVIDIHRMDNKTAIEYLTKSLLNLKSTASKKIKLLLANYNAEILHGIFMNFVFGDNRNDKIELYGKKAIKSYKLAMIVKILSSKNFKKEVETILKMSEQEGSKNVNE